MPRRTRRATPARAVFHHVATLIASTAVERRHELRRSPRSCAPARRGRTSPAAGRASTARTSWPRSREPLQVLEDDAVAAADAGVLGHVDDPQPAVLGARTARSSNHAPQRSQKRRCEASSRSPCSVPRVLDSRWVSVAYGQ